MEVKGKVHCLFEQSGTFKNEFIKLGINAEDYDIQNNFGQTDHIIDLFGEIDKEYDYQTRQDKTRQDKTRQDKTRQDKTRQDKTRQDKTRQFSVHSMFVKTWYLLSFRVYTLKVCL